ncbi:MAG: DinB family protein [Anaerolineae bacterium]|nr:DinB family protein [Anaerolineae bacterium]
MLIETVRSWQYNIMGYTLKTVESIFTAADPDALTKYRDSGDGWTALEVLGHLRDFEGVLFERTRVTVEQDLPTLPFPNPDELARQRDYNHLSWRTLLTEWRAERAAHLAYLQARTEGDWDRPGMHPKRGRLTLLDQLFLLTQHDSLHIEQMTRTLAERRIDS